MRRREFIAMLCSGAAFWPAAIHAQQHDEIRAHDGAGGAWETVDGDALHHARIDILDPQV
jgi:hypothetical protein